MPAAPHTHINSRDSRQLLRRMCRTLLKGWLVIAAIAAIAICLERIAPTEPLELDFRGLRGAVMAAFSGGIWQLFWTAYAIEKITAHRNNRRFLLSGSLLLILSWCLLVLSICYGGRIYRFAISG